MEEGMSKAETPRKPNTKIDCKCRRSVLALLRSVEKHTNNVFSRNDIPATGNAIAEIYKGALLSNILIEGKTLKGDESDLDTTTEFEPFDTSKEHHIEHVLMDRLDRQIVNTTRLRKTASKQVRRKMKQMIRPQLKYAALVTVQSQSDENKDNETQSRGEAIETKPQGEAMDTQSGGEAIETQSRGEEAMDTDSSVTSGTVNLEEIQTRLKTVAEKCSFVHQTCTDMLQKSRDLSQALQILKQSEKSEVVKAIYETPPSTPTVSFGTTSLNKDLQTTKQISKKLLI